MISWLRKEWDGTLIEKERNDFRHSQGYALHGCSWSSTPRGDCECSFQSVSHSGRFFYTRLLPQSSRVFNECAVRGGKLRAGMCQNWWAIHQGQHFGPTVPWSGCWRSPWPFLQALPILCFGEKQRDGRTTLNKTLSTWQMWFVNQGMCFIQGRVLGAPVLETKRSTRHLLEAAVRTDRPLWFLHQLTFLASIHTTSDTSQKLALLVNP